MRKLLIVVAAVILLGASCDERTPTEDEAVDTGTAASSDATTNRKDLNQPIRYDLEDVNAVEQRSLLMVRRVFRTGTLVVQSEECGTNLTIAHFSEVLRRFENQRGHQYDFTYQGESQEPRKYTVTVFPNGPRYENLEAFRNDFNVCHVGGTMYPFAANPDWLVFVSGCGGGLDDGSGLPTGCDLIRAQIEKTLEIQ